jgi:hypothetical protein
MSPSAPPGIDPAPRRFRREILAVLGLKAVGLAVLYLLFFSPSHRPALTTTTVVNHLVAPGAASGGSEVTHDR